MGLYLNDDYPIGGTPPADKVYLIAGETDIRVTHPETGDEFEVVVDGDGLRCEPIDDAH